MREKQKFLKVREKSGNFLKSQGKSLILSKSVKSQGDSVFQFTVHKFKSSPPSPLTYLGVYSNRDFAWVGALAPPLFWMVK